MRWEGFYINKNPLTPAGIESATFRFVAQHLNHCATAVPPVIQDFIIIIIIDFDGGNYGNKEQSVASRSHMKLKI